MVEEIRKTARTLQIDMLVAAQYQPVVMQRQVSIDQHVHRMVGVPNVEIVDKMVDDPTIMERHVSEEVEVGGGDVRASWRS